MWNLKIFNYLKQFTRSIASKNQFIHINEEVGNALKQNVPIVCLESTYLTHGLPLDQAFEIGQSIEQIIRNNGIVPATIAIMNNQIQVGLNQKQMYNLIEASKNGLTNKACIRDLPILLTKSINTNYEFYSLTVSATSYIANQVGIQLLTTTGIGGIHYGWPQIFDISSDLIILSRLPMVVFSSGVKSILDISNTLELLETLGISVITIGTDEFPAFFTRSSGLKHFYRLDTPEKTAELIHTMNNLKWNSSLLIALPIDKTLEPLTKTINKSIEKVKSDSLNSNHTTGLNVTTNLLEQVHKLSNYESIKAYIDLLKNNVNFASQTAFCLKILQNHKHKSIIYFNQNHINNFNETQSQVHIFGGSKMKYVIKLKNSHLHTINDLNHTEQNLSAIIEQIGGNEVGRNIAELYGRLHISHTFYTCLGTDELGENLKNHYKFINWSIKKLPKNLEFRTATNIILLNHKNDLLLKIDDLDIYERLNSKFIEESLSNFIKINKNFNKSNLIIFDSNLTMNAMSKLIQFSQMYHLPLCYEPTNYLKCYKFIKAIKQIKNELNYELFKPISVITPNLNELLKLIENYTGNILNLNDINAIQTHSDLCQFISTIITQNQLFDLSYSWIIKLDSRGLIFVNDERIEWFGIPVKNPQSILNVSGAGDCLVAMSVYLHYVIGLSWHTSLLGGLRAAEYSLYSGTPVSTNMKSDDFQESSIKEWGKGIEYFRFK